MSDDHPARSHYGDAGETFGNPDDPDPADDQYIQPIKLLLSAKLVVGQREFLCIVRRLLPGGIAVNLLGPVPLHGALTLELANGRQFPVTVELCEGHSCQLRFLEPSDRTRFISDANEHFASRPLRLRAEEDVAVIVAGQRFPAKLSNISQFGAGIRCAKLMHIGEAIQLETGFLPPTPARIAWRKRESYGLIFLRHYSLAQISDAFSPPAP